MLSLAELKSRLAEITGELLKEGVPIDVIQEAYRLELLEIRKMQIEGRRSNPPRTVTLEMKIVAMLAAGYRQADIVKALQCSSAWVSRVNTAHKGTQSG